MLYILWVWTINNMYLPLEEPTEKFCCPNNPLCSTCFSYFPQPPATTDHFTISTVLPFLECHMEKAMAPHSSTLAWSIPRTEEPGRLQSIGSRRVRHDRVTSLSLLTFMHWRRKRQPSVLAWKIPGTGEPGGLLSLGSHRVRHDWSGLAAAAAAAAWFI